MLRLILPVVLGIVGAGAGIAAGIFLKPAPEVHAELPPCGPGEDHGSDTAKTDKSADAGHSDTDGGEAPSANEITKLNNQFVVPVLRDGTVGSLVVMGLSIEAEPGTRETIFQLEPKLRDRFLTVMFDHANSGGFDGNFTQGTRLDDLRRALRETARMIVDDRVIDVLLTELARQDS